MKTAIMLAALCCFAVSPLPALGEDSDLPTLSPDEVKAKKKADKDAKKAAAREKLKFKWHKSLKAAKAAAKKNNCALVVLYSNPDYCAYCRKLDNEIFDSKDFKAAKGIGVGYKSITPVNEYGLNQGMPRGVVCDPSGKKVADFGYVPGWKPDEYIKLFKQGNPAVKSDDSSVN